MRGKHTPGPWTAVDLALDHARRQSERCLGRLEAPVIREHLCLLVQEVDRLRALEARGVFSDTMLASIDRYDIAARNAWDAALEEVVVESDRRAGEAVASWPSVTGYAMGRADAFGQIGKFARSRKTSPADRLEDEVRRWGT